MATQHNQSYPGVSRLSQLWLAQIRDHWMYREAEKRDLRLDFLRGLCIFIMVVDHIGGYSPLRILTGGNLFFVSAAEGFVFISGLLLGTIYRRIIEREGFRAALLKALRRARTLYILTFVLTFMLAYVTWWIGAPWTPAEEIANPLRFALDVLTVRDSYLFTDILMLYTLLIIGAPVALWLLERGWTWALLLGSWALWLLYQVSPYDASQPLPTIHSFHPAAWQIFFVHAMALGYHRQRVARWFHRVRHGPLLAWLGLFFVLLVAVYYTQGALLRPLIGGDVAAFMQATFLKNPVRVGRLVAALIVFPLAYLTVTYCWLPLRRALGWLLLPLGQNSLYSYTMHLPIIVLWVMLFAYLPGTTAAQQMINGAIQLAAVLALWVMIRGRFLFGIVPR
ncbi:MAG TPA: OpgC domain-containing protein [Herpetosiphonaceae bacterium]